MKRILIVDDEPPMIRVITYQLTRQGYAVENAPDGRAGLERILANPPDVLVTDILMPRMTGRELCLALEQQHPQRSFPIFVMTSMTDREHREWTAKIANLEFMEKPISTRILIARLEKHFGATGAS